MGTRAQVAGFVALGFDLSVASSATAAASAAETALVRQFSVFGVDTDHSSGHEPVGTADRASAPRAESPMWAGRLAALFL